MNPTKFEPAARSLKVNKQVDSGLKYGSSYMQAEPKIFRKTISVPGDGVFHHSIYKKERAMDTPKQWALKQPNWKLEATEVFCHSGVLGRGQESILPVAASGEMNCSL